MSAEHCITAAILMFYAFGFYFSVPLLLCKALWAAYHERCNTNLLYLYSAFKLPTQTHLCVGMGGAQERVKIKQNNFIVEELKVNKTNQG